MAVMAFTTAGTCTECEGPRSRFSTTGMCWRCEQGRTWSRQRITNDDKHRRTEYRKPSVAQFIYRNCRQCKKRFKINHGSQYLCSDECREERKKELKKKEKPRKGPRQTAKEYFARGLSHGTERRYSGRGNTYLTDPCRCNICVAAHVERLKERKKRRAKS